MKIANHSGLKESTRQFYMVQYLVFIINTYFYHQQLWMNCNCQCTASNLLPGYALMQIKLLQLVTFKKWSKMTIDRDHNSLVLNLFHTIPLSTQGA